MDASAGITALGEAATTAGLVLAAVLAFVVVKFAGQKVIGLFGR